MPEARLGVGLRADAEARADARRAAGPALEAQLAAERADPLAHADEPETPGLRSAAHRRVDVEPGPIVDDVDLDGVADAPHVDRGLRRATVLRNVGERRLDEADDRDALRLGEIAVVEMLGPRNADAAVLAVESLDGLPERLDQRALEEPGRLGRECKVPQVDVDDAEPREQVVDAPEEPAGIRVSLERPRELFFEEVGVRAESDDVLQRAVVKVETEQHDALMCRLELVPEPDQHLTDLRELLRKSRREPLRLVDEVVPSGRVLRLGRAEHRAPVSHTSRPLIRGFPGYTSSAGGVSIGDRGAMVGAPLLALARISPAAAALGLARFARRSRRASAGADPARALGDVLEATHDPERLLALVLQAVVATTGARAGHVRADDAVVARIGTVTHPLGLRLPIPSREPGSELWVELSGSAGGLSPAAAERARLLAARTAVAIDNVRRHGAAQKRATTDELTDLANRWSFLERLAQEFDRSRRYGTPLAVLATDLDRFKDINDAFGHATGDRALEAFADVLRGHVRGLDTVGRLGGDEFGIVLPESDPSGAAGLAERIRAATAELRVFAPDGTRLVLTSSFGVGAVARGETSARELLSAADKALYRAKSAGRNCVSIQPMSPARLATQSG